jgi:hypothetical protein
MMIDTVAEDRSWSRRALFSGGVSVLAMVSVVVALGSSSGQVSGGNSTAEQSIRLGLLILLIMAPIAFYLTVGVWTSALTLCLRLVDISTDAKVNFGIMAVAELGKLLTSALLALMSYRNASEVVVGPNGGVVLSAFGPKPGVLSVDMLVWGVVVFLIFLKARTIKPIVVVIASILLIAARWSTAQLLLALT